MSEPTVVLVVAGDPDLRCQCRVALEADGLAVREAADGAGALELVGEQPPEIVLLEVGGAASDGWRTLDVIRSRSATRDLPVVLLSPREREPDRARGWARGATDHLAWPFAQLAISQVVQDVLATGPGEARRRRQAAVDRPDLLPSM